MVPPMNNADVKSPVILVASDKADAAAMVQKLLEADFGRVRTATTGDTALADFEQQSPVLILLVFDTLDKSAKFLRDLYGLNQRIRMHPHRTIVLCEANEASQAYALCREGGFDDYVPFWPVATDSGRLPSSVRLALRELAAYRESGPSIAEFAIQARQMAEMENLLKSSLAKAEQYMETAQRPAPAGAAGVRSASAQWVSDFKRDIQPYRDNARALLAMADLTEPLILVVEDEELQRNLVNTILVEAKYRVVFAHSGIQALNVLGRVRPDLVLMDLVMPDMDGLQTTMHIKAVKRHARLPIIIATAKSDDDTVRGSLKAGAVDFIVKPLKPAALLAKIGRALRQASASAPAAP